MIYLFEFGLVLLLVGFQFDYCLVLYLVMIGGIMVLDMCLYDGMGLQSEYLGIIVCDMGLVVFGCLDMQYLVWYCDGGCDLYDCVDYQFMFVYNGQCIVLCNNDEVLLCGIDIVELCLVMLFDMNQWVYCVFILLIFDMFWVFVVDKCEGYYEGWFMFEMCLFIICL